MPCIRTFAKPFVGPFVRPFFRLFAKLFAIMFLMSFDTSFISKFFMIPYHFYTICIIICHVMSCLYHLHYHLWCHSHTIFQNIRQANWKIATSLVGFCLKWFGSIFRWGFGLECPPAFAIFYLQYSLPCHFSCQFPNHLSCHSSYLQLCNFSCHLHSCHIIKKLQNYPDHIADK